MRKGELTTMTLSESVPIGYFLSMYDGQRTFLAECVDKKGEDCTFLIVM